VSPLLIRVAWTPGGIVCDRRVLDSTDLNLASVRNVRRWLAVGDAFALIDRTTSALRVRNGVSTTRCWVDADGLLHLRGVHPWQYRDYAALRGDPSDNLHGVQRFGTAAARLPWVPQLRWPAGTRKLALTWGNGQAGAVRVCH